MLTAVKNALVFNDAAAANESVYCFLGNHCGNARVADVGSRLGRGARRLRRNGARSVFGLERSRKARWLARLLNPSLALSFGNGGIEELDGRRFDLVVIHHELALFGSAEEHITRLRRCLSSGGICAAAVPVAVHEEARGQLTQAGYTTALYPWYWQALFANEFREVEVYRQAAPPQAWPDFASPSPSALDPTTFQWERIEARELVHNPGIGVLFLARA